MPSIHDDIKELPELCQKIFGFPEYDNEVSRLCDDRFADILKVIDGLSSFLGRKLKILDLGCAQGYISLKLASYGHFVTGVDFLEKNITVCKDLARVHSIECVEFVCSPIEDFLNTLIKKQVDLVIGLSVFHHIIHAHGLAYVLNLMKKLSEYTLCALFEFAVKEEGLYWTKSLPVFSDETLEPYSFFLPLNYYHNHLTTNVKRPLYFASNFLWYIKGEFERFEKFSLSSHKLDSNSHLGTRRYFFGNAKFLRFVKLTGKNASGRFDYNKTECDLEVKFNAKQLTGFNKIKLLKYEQTDDYFAFIYERKYGENLLNYLLDNKPFDTNKLIMQIINQLVILEKNSLFHMDLRPWNVFITTDNKVLLIDYGSISDKKIDCNLYYSSLLSFQIFIGMLLRVIPLTSLIESITNINPSILPEPYNKIFLRIYAQSSWSFTDFYNTDLLNDNNPLFLEMFDKYKLLLDSLTPSIASLNKEKAILLTRLNITGIENKLLKEQLAGYNHSLYRLAANIYKMQNKIRAFFKKWRVKG